MGSTKTMKDLREEPAVALAAGHSVVEDIIQAEVRQEIAFLARSVLRAPTVRAVMFSWIMHNLPETGIRGAGIDDDELIASLIDELRQGLRAPSGGGGGGDTGTGESQPSGGGGGPDDPTLHLILPKDYKKKSTAAAS